MNTNAYKNHVTRNLSAERLRKIESPLNQKVIDSFGIPPDVNAVYDSLEKHHKAFIREFSPLKDELNISFMDSGKTWGEVAYDSKVIIDNYLEENNLNNFGISVGIDTWLLLKQHTWQVNDTSGDHSILEGPITNCGCSQGASQRCHTACAILIVCIILLIIL